MWEKFDNIRMLILSLEFLNLKVPINKAITPLRALNVNVIPRICNKDDNHNFQLNLNCVNYHLHNIFPRSQLINDSIGAVHGSIQSYLRASF